MRWTSVDPTFPRLKTIFSTFVAAVGLNAPSASAESIDYNRDVRPILADTCFNCHGIDENSRKAKLRLDTFEGATARRDGGAAIIPGKPDASELVRRIFESDPDEQMPPSDHAVQLTATQKNLLRQWIAEGAEYQRHWAFVSPTRPITKTRNAIDEIVRRELSRRGWKPSPRADRLTLIRRLSLDLTGLPPTPDEVDAFVTDRSANAYEKQVDRLLASPRFGERMAMWWLDGARYADSHGFQADWERYQWPWRDWVINAFNANQPFDQFTIEQLAGDLLPNAKNSQIVATGFNRNHRINTEGGSLNEEWLVENVIDRVETTGSVWLGLTLGCARCHDHKYDPVTQREFYQLFAFFHNVPEQGKGPGKQGNFTPTLSVERPDIDAQLRRLDGALDEAKKALAVAKRQARSRSKKNDAVQFFPLKQAKVSSKNGATFKMQSDHSFLASGKNPKRDSYTISSPIGSGRPTGVLLEALPDPSMANKSLGRAHNGNFVLSGIEASLNGEQVKLGTPTATYEQKGWPIANSLDGKNNTGWAVDGNTKFDARKALFLVEELPANSDNGRFELKLHFNAIDQHAIGRFRVSLTNHPLPALPGKAADPPAVAKAKKRIGQIEKQRKDLTSKAPTVMVMQEMEKPRDTFVLERGQYDQPREKVEAGLPSAFPPLPRGAPRNRLGLARWIVSPTNPLTARVQVNRIWELLFGTGIVATSENFGTQAELPSHPELLDWLATEFVRLGWDTKALLKTIVMSETYRQASAFRKQDALDPQNRLLARGPRFRVQAEMVRDGALFISGLLKEKLGGPSVRPYQPPGIWSEFNFYGNLRNYKHDTGEGLYRRSLYTIWKRTAAPPAMTLFDMPSREICTVKRARTNTPLQALALMNDVTYVEASRHLARRMLAEGGSRIEDQITHGFRLATSRTPADHELRLLVDGFQRRLERYKANPEGAKQLISLGESAPTAGRDPAMLAALATTASIILNLDETITKE